MYRANPELKATSFIQSSLEERQKLQEKSAYEALMVKNDHILEGLTSNFFYFRGGKLGTARSGILNGVTRRQVLRLAAGQGIPLIFRALPLEHLPKVEEAFLTSSSRGIVPIVRVDEVAIGSGRVGEQVRRLMRSYDADIETRAEKINWQ
jgi:branched-subunit amino acid aminotransferase/4-amino-4-deoxychorismate lyase